MLVVVAVLVFGAEGENGNRSSVSFRGSPARALQRAAKKPVCPPGYIDHTGGNAWIWRCGETCKGAGIHGAWSDRHCQCACVDPADCVSNVVAGTATVARRKQGDDCIVAYEKTYDQTGALPTSNSQAGIGTTAGPKFVAPAPSAPGALGGGGVGGITGVKPGVAGTAQTNVPTARPVGYQQLGSTGSQGTSVNAAGQTVNAAGQLVNADGSIVETKDASDDYTVLIVLISTFVVCCVGGMVGGFCFVFMCNNEHIVVVQKLKRTFSRAGTGNLEAVSMAQPRAMCDDEGVKPKPHAGQPPKSSPRGSPRGEIRASLNVQIGDRPAMSPRGSPKPSPREHKPHGSPRPSPRDNTRGKEAALQESVRSLNAPGQTPDKTQVSKAHKLSPSPPLASPESTSPRPSPRAKLEDPRGAAAPRYHNAHSPRPSPRGADAKLEDPRGAGAPRYGNSPRPSPRGGPNTNDGPRNAGVAGAPGIVPALDLSPKHSPEGGAPGG